MTTKAFYSNPRHLIHRHNEANQNPELYFLIKVQDGQFYKSLSYTRLENTNFLKEGKFKEAPHFQ